jgi:hypothetical protein
MLSALESEKYLAALHRTQVAIASTFEIPFQNLWHDVWLMTQEAVQHIEDLKVKEIAYEVSIGTVLEGKTN